ncbi:hypothetical protein WICMUC_001057 [Wickerhamomyces mucosus]|uniref:Ribosomal lysine N-methyltransferase 4 n=1 Tax=Wickerhamomyces mucosus TaxID=1378264 RepID=A0A9P8PXD6_9ASCO|nr:hypothetical protein WICMUC_001057 [Wickerhamomyces mucosus]
MDIEDNFNIDTENYIQWTQNSGFQISPKVQIQDLRTFHQGRGLVAIEDISTDEILFKIPRNVLLNIETGSLANNVPNHTDNREKLLTEYDHWAGLILTLLYEFSLGEDSKWAPYLKLLPTEHKTLTYWSKDELDNLKPSLILDRIGIDSAQDLYNELFPSSLIDLGIPDLEVNLEKFHQICTIIMSYSFDVENPDFDEDEEDEEVVKFDGYLKSMVSLADLLNADTNLNNAKLIYDRDFLYMKSFKPIAKNEQIYNIYGDHPNSELLRRYGYIEWKGSKFDFGEIQLDLIKDYFLEIYNIDKEIGDFIVDEVIPQNDVEELEENIVLDSFDCYKDGEIIAEALVLIQSLVILGQIHQHYTPIKSMGLEGLTKNLNRILKKCYQLIESKSMTYQCKQFIQHLIHKRLDQYPSHSFREVISFNDDEFFDNRLKIAETILKTEVYSLQTSLQLFDKDYKLISDEKLLRNILKKRTNVESLETSNKKFKQ